MSRADSALVRGVATAIALLITACGSSENGPSALYERLGGLATIAVIVDDLMASLAVDPLLNENAAVAAARARVPAPYIKYHITSQLCEAAGGPCQYVGRSMRDSHAHLGIQQAEWDRMMQTLGEVLEENGIGERERQELLDIFASLEGEIVL